MGRRVQIGPSMGFVSHRGHLKGVCATASRGSDTLGCAALWRWGQTQWAATVVVSAASAREPSCVLPACAGSRVGHAGPSAKPAGARTSTRRAAREPRARHPLRPPVPARGSVGACAATHGVRPRVLAPRRHARRPAAIECDCRMASGESTVDAASGPVIRSRPRRASHPPAVDVGGFYGCGLAQRRISVPVIAGVLDAGLPVRQSARVRACRVNPSWV